MRILLCFLIAAVLNTTVSSAQKAIKVSEQPEVYYNRPNGNALCYETEALKKVSAQMYQDGNEKYIWIDLLIDNLIPSNYNNCIQLIPNEKYPMIHGYAEMFARGNIAILYYDKFNKFLKKHGYNTTLPIYNFKFQDLSSTEIFDPNSNFRQVNTADLKRMLLLPKD